MILVQRFIGNDEIKLTEFGRPEVFGPFTLGPSYIIQFDVQNRQFGRSHQEQVELLRIYNKNGDCCDMGQRIFLLTASKTNYFFILITD